MRIVVVKRFQCNKNILAIKRKFILYKNLEILVEQKNRVKVIRKQKTIVVTANNNSRNFNFGEPFI